MNVLIKAFEQWIEVDELLHQQLEERAKLISVKDGDKLLLQEQYCQTIYFLKEGLIRTYYMHDDKEVTTWFYTAGHFVTSWYSFYNQQRSFEGIDALEPSILYTISYKDYQDLINNNSSFETFARKLAEEQLTFIDQYSKGYMFLSAEERYQRLLQYIPEIELRAKLGQIASYLGISQETLSRIRGKK